jgi:hypothetical protein
MVQKPCRLLLERHAEIDRFNFPEMLFGISATLSNDFLGPSFSLGLRHLPRTERGADTNALVRPFILSWYIDAKPNVESVALAFDITTLTRPT